MPDAMDCPQCGAQIAVDRRFVVWCDQCNWNIDPQPTAEQHGRETRRRKLAIEAGRRLLDSIRKSALDRPTWSRETLAALAVAGAIHLGLIAITAIGLYVLVTNFRDLFGYLFGLPLILLGVLARPRLGRLPKHAVVLKREEAPATYGLVDRVAAALGSKTVELIVLDHAYNASMGRYGLRQSRVMTLGAAIWNVLDNSERVALIGHEIGHLVNGDPTRGLVLGSALRSLQEFDMALRVPPVQHGTGNPFELFEWIVNLSLRGLYRLIRAALGRMQDFELSLVRKSQQRAEYFADLLSARVASTSAAIGCLDMLFLDDVAWFYVRKAARAQEVDVWSSERHLIAELPAKEAERIRRLDAAAGTSIDSTHPPTSLRIELLRSRPQVSATVAIAPQEATAIDAELQPALSQIQEKLLKRFAH